MIVSLLFPYHPFSPSLTPFSLSALSAIALRSLPLQYSPHKPTLLPSNLPPFLQFLRDVLVNLHLLGMTLLASVQANLTTLSFLFSFRNRIRLLSRHLFDRSTSPSPFLSPSLLAHSSPHPPSPALSVYLVCGESFHRDCHVVGRSSALVSYVSNSLRFLAIPFSLFPLLSPLYYWQQLPLWLITQEQFSCCLAVSKLCAVLLP